MTDSPSDEIVARYETTMMLFVVLPSLALIFFTYKYLSAIIADFMIVTLIAGEAVALTWFVIVGARSFRRYRRFPWLRKYFGTLLYSILFLPMLGLGAVMGANCALDGSAPTRRVVTVVDKAESHRIRKGRRRDRWYVYVNSWRPDMDRIQIRVGGSDFEQFDEGDKVVVWTKPGLLGLEWLTEDQR